MNANAEIIGSPAQSLRDSSTDTSSALVGNRAVDATDRSAVVLGSTRRSPHPRHLSPDQLQLGYPVRPHGR
jgi:hypothetical protein